MGKHHTLPALSTRQLHRKLQPDPMGDFGMLDVDGDILKSAPEYRDALLAEKKLYERIHATTKSVLAEVGNRDKK